MAETVFLRWEDDQLVGVYAKKPKASSAASWHYLDGTEPPKVRIEERKVLT